jgi:hypothetical protein
MPATPANSPPPRAQADPPVAHDLSTPEKEQPVMLTPVRNRLRWLGALTLAAVASGATMAQGNIRSERIQFKKGAGSAIVNGRIKGPQTVDYLVSARKGQSANISLATQHPATYFNILAPGKTDEAFFNGSVSQNQFEGVLPDTGTYRVRVYMMRSAARRSESASYRLELAIGGAVAPQAPAPSTDAKVAGTDFNATGNLPCAMGGGQQPTTSCTFGVKRQGPGNGLVTVTKPDGGKRTIFFDKGRATGYDASQADKAAFKATHQGDLTTVHIGDERYEIPDAVINGG